MSISSQKLQQIEKDVCEILVKHRLYLVNKWNSSLSYSLKDQRDIVTQVDIEIENRLKADLLRILPQAGFIGEESKSIIKDEYNWVVDPIDGTKNFAFHTPLFFSQVALMKNEKPILGAILNPVSNQLFSASLGHGVQLNNRKIIYSFRRSITESIIDFDIREPEKWKLDVLSKVASKCYRIRSSGGFMNPYLLTGAIDAVINFVLKDYSLSQSSKTLSDHAPHHILFSEAGIGSRFVRLSNNKTIFIAAHPKLLESILYKLNL